MNLVNQMARLKVVKSCEELSSLALEVVTLNNGLWVKTLRGPKDVKTFSM